MNELTDYIVKVNYYILQEYFIDLRENNNNVIFNWYFESFTKNESYQNCAGKICSYLKKESKIKPM